MNRSKEADLVTAVYLYAARCWTEGDLAALREMGFGREEAEALMDLGLADLQRLATVAGHPLRVSLDVDTFRLIVAHLQRERANEQALRALILADAPLPMLEALFALSGREYSGWRQILRMPPAPGRPPNADEATSHRLWHAWRERLGERDPEELTPSDYLALHEETGTPMRILWSLVQRWTTRCGPEGDDTTGTGNRRAADYAPPRRASGAG